MTNTKDKLNLWINPNTPASVQRTLKVIIKGALTQVEGRDAVNKRVREAMQRAGTDLDIFDFYRGGEEYGQTTCPCCSGQADLWLRGPSVQLVCTKCPFDAEWKCEFETTTLGGHGSIHLVRADDEIPF